MTIRRLIRTSLLALLALAPLAGSFSPRAEAAPPNRNPPPQMFEIEYFWGYPSLPPAGTGPTAVLTLSRDGTFTAYDTASGDSGTGTWFSRRGGREIVFVIDGNPVTYVGTRVSPGYYEGTMAFTVPNGPEGVWRGHFVP